MRIIVHLHMWIPVKAIQLWNTYMQGKRALLVDCPGKAHMSLSSRIRLDEALQQGAAAAAEKRSP